MSLGEGSRPVVEQERVSQGGSALCRPAVAAPGRRAAGGRSGKRCVRTRRGPGTLQPRVSCLARAGPWAEGSATAVTYSEDTGARWADLRLVTLATVGLQVAERARPEAIAASSARFTGAPSSTVTVSCEFASA